MSIIFVANIYHEYFASRVIPDCRIQPSATTQPLLQRYGISLIPNGSSLVLFSNLLSAVRCVDALIEIGLRLEFDLLLDPEKLFEITESPSDWTGKISIHIEDLDGPPQVYFSTEFSPDAAPIRLIVCPKALDSDSARHVDCSLAARMTARRYFVFNHSDLDLSAATVVDHDGRQFESEPIRIKDQSSGFLFDSGEVTYRLAERPKEWMQLTAPGRRKALVKRLPTPSTHLTVMGGDRSALRTCSEIFVYL